MIIQNYFLNCSFLKFSIGLLKRSYFLTPNVKCFFSFIPNKLICINISFSFQKPQNFRFVTPLKLDVEDHHLITFNLMHLCCLKDEQTFCRPHFFIFTKKINNNNAKTIECCVLFLFFFLLFLVLLTLCIKHTCTHTCINNTAHQSKGRKKGVLYFFDKIKCFPFTHFTIKINLETFLFY